MAEALEHSDHVFEDLFFFEGNTHLPLEQHASVAAPDGEGKLTLWSIHPDAALRPPRPRAGAARCRPRTSA